MPALSYFEHQLVMYVTAEDKSTFDDPFDISSVPVVTKEQADAEERTKKLTTATPTLKAPREEAKKPAANSAEALASVAASQQKYAQQLQAIPEMKEYGALLKSSPIVELTESETEYVVSVIKHIFQEHIVLQYEVKNTLPDTILEEVSVLATPEAEDELEEDFILPAPKLSTDEPGTIYVSFRKVSGEAAFVSSTFTNILKFTSKEIDPSTGEPEESGYDDEYQVEDLDLNGADYVVPAFAGNFAHIWEQVGAAGEEEEETLQLSNLKSINGKLVICRSYGQNANDITDATETLAKTLSLQPLDGTDMPTSTTTHTLKLYGKTVTGGRVAANIRMAFASKTGVTAKFTVRAEEEGVAALVLGSLA
jgi:coatomer protein complex subunit gamma